MADNIQKNTTKDQMPSDEAIKQIKVDISENVDVTNNSDSKCSENKDAGGKSMESDETVAIGSDDKVHTDKNDIGDVEVDSNEGEKQSQQDTEDPCQKEEKEETSDNDEEVELGDTKSLDSDGRNKLFEKGLTFDKQGKINCALKCYMGCLNGLTQNSRFPLLPQCLRNIGDIYYQKEEYERAVHFLQAEKVFYESALIDTADMKHRMELEQKNVQNGDTQQEQDMETVRADEYEHLARLCLDKQQPQLALEYAGKATKIRQQLYGDSHPETVKSLDFFASVYAEVGAEQYKESMKIFSNPEENQEQTQSEHSKQEPVSILRKRKSLDKDKKVRFEEPLIKNHEQMAKEETIAKSVLWTLLVVCLILLVIMGVYLYCHIWDSSCSSLKTTIHYAYMRMKYFYYHYMTSNEKAKYT